MSILIKNGTLINGQKNDILIKGNIIEKIGKIDAKADKVIDAEHMAVIPSFVNGHTHAAMTLFKGYADDMQLDEWLQNKIWPLESNLTENDVYWGTKLACLEMIKSGTTFMNDMYWHANTTIEAVQEMGIRASVSSVYLDMNKEMRDKHVATNINLHKESKKCGTRIQFSLGPHALYTVSEDLLKWTKEYSDKHGLLIHFHLSETEKEVNDCMEAHGKRPVEYLNSIGFLSPSLVACHSVWMNRAEIALLKKHNVKVVHNPVSNQKLAVGGVFPYNEFKEHGITMALGTDGSASNNNLDMFEEMKIAAIMQKYHNRNSEAMPAKEIFHMATKGGADSFGLNCGEIKEGKLADLLLVNLKAPGLVPNHNLVSNLVYSANGSVVDTTICNGKILMQNRKVPGEDKIITKAAEVAKDFVSRA